MPARKMVPDNPQDVAVKRLDEAVGRHFASLPDKLDGFIPIRCGFWFSGHHPAAIETVDDPRRLHARA